MGRQPAGVIARSGQGDHRLWWHRRLGDAGVRADAQPFLGARAAWVPGDVMADGVSPDDGAAARSFRVGHRGGDRDLTGASRKHQLNIGQGAHVPHRQAARFTGRSSTGLQASSPSVRSLWWHHRASLRATERAGSLPWRRWRAAR
jgi:hypothetical protein